MVEFNPFEKDLAKVEFDDLARLRSNNVAEGYSVEYKRDVPGSDPGNSIAKTVASFANTYGGWLFLGIQERFNNEAGAPNGIDLAKHPQPKETIQQWVQTRVHPNPNFTSSLIDHPDHEDKAILIVHVPQSWDTPHVMTDGVVYRRTGEQSKPIEPETDRWALDRLYQRRFERERKRTRVLQHLRALKNEIERNADVIWGNRRVIRHFQQGKVRDEEDHYAVELLSVDAWEAALNTQLLDVIDESLYEDIQDLYFSIKSVNELIRRTRNEWLHPKVGKKKGRPGGWKIWTINVTYWDADGEEVDFYGLGSLIWKRLASMENSIDDMISELESEITRLENEVKTGAIDASKRTS